MRLHTILIASLFTACAAQAPDDINSDGTDDGDGNGDGTGGGSGSGNGSGTGPGGGSQGMTATKFLEQINTKFCTQAFTCKASFPTDAGTTFDQEFGASQQACAADGLAADNPAAVEMQISAGKISFNSTDAAACLSGIVFSTCDAFWNGTDAFPSACATVLVGKVADGGACVTHIECSGQASYCDETSNTCTADTGEPAP